MPGQPPKTWPTQKPGWYDYWLRKSIRYEVEGNKAVIFSNPAKSPGKSFEKLPQTIEFGGSVIDARRRLVGYTIFTERKYKQPRVHFVPIHERVRGDAVIPGEQPRKTIAPHPFMAPALEKIRPKIPQAWRDAVRAEFG